MTDLSARFTLKMLVDPLHYQLRSVPTGLYVGFDNNKVTLLVSPCRAQKWHLAML